MMKISDRDSGLTVERVRKLLTYDPSRGVLLRHGKIVGSIRKDGYRMIQIDGRGYLAHRIIWLYVTGSWPTDELDHVNGTPGDDRFDNLREATHRLNQSNSKRRCDNTSGFKGVSFFRRDSNWRATIRASGRKQHLGYFATKEEAHAAYVETAERLRGAFANPG